MLDTVGAVFTATTVNKNPVLALLVPSLTLTVIVALPVCPAAPVAVTVRFDPDPPNTMLAFGTSVGLDELPLTVKLPAAVSTSPTVKLNGPAVPPMLIV